MALSPEIASIVVAAAKKYGQNPDYMLKQAQIESGGDPDAYNKSGASGLFQFMPKTAAGYNLADPFDPVASSDAAARLARDNGAYLTKTLGREPTPGELYLAHQQGMGGASKILANPDASAASLVGSKAVTQNGGAPDETAAQFAARWTGKFDGIGASPQSPAMTLPGAVDTASGRFAPTSAGVEGSSAPAPTMTTPAAPADDPIDAAKILASLTQQAAPTAAVPQAQQAPPMLAPMQRPKTPFDPSAFYALLARKR
jgi:hypothetical protein